MANITNRTHPDGYTVLDNRGINCHDISFRATGLWAYVKSKPANWEVNVKHLAKQKKEGRDAIYKALNELIEAGLVVRTERRNGGQFNEVCYDFYDYPLPKDADPYTADVPPCPEKPDTEKPDTEKPDTENPDAYKLLKSTTTEISNYSHNNPRVSVHTSNHSPDDLPSSKEAIARLGDRWGAFINHLVEESRNWSAYQSCVSDQARAAKIKRVYLVNQFEKGNLSNLIDLFEENYSATAQKNAQQGASNGIIESLVTIAKRNPLEAQKQANELERSKGLPKNLYWNKVLIQL